MQEAFNKKTKDIPGEVILTQKLFGRVYCRPEIDNLMMAYKADSSSNNGLRSRFQVSPESIPYSMDSIGSTVENIVRDINPTRAQGKIIEIK